MKKTKWSKRFRERETERRKLGETGETKRVELETAEIETGDLETGKLGKRGNWDRGFRDIRN